MARQLLVLSLVVTGALTILYAILSFNANCRGCEVVPTPTQTATVQVTSTPSPTPQHTPTPTALSPGTYVLWKDDGSKFDLVGSKYLVYQDLEVPVNVVIADPDRTIKQQLGTCRTDIHIVVSGTSVLESHRSIMWGDSGNCKKGPPMPFETIRKSFEGYYWSPDPKLREKQLKELLGEKVCFQDRKREGVCLRINEAAFLSEDAIKKLDSEGIDIGVPDNLFEYNRSVNGDFRLVTNQTQEVILVFCGSQGSLEYFDARYVISLVP